MKNLYNLGFDWLVNQIRGPWPDAVPLPKHVVDLKLDPQLLMLHLVKTTNGTGR